MQKLLQRFTDTENPNNFLLVPLPTGVGKTYNVAKFITQFVKSGDPRKIYFTTPLKKNLRSVMKDLRKMLDEEGLDYNSIVLNINSITDHLIRNYTKYCREKPGLKEEIRSCFPYPEVFDDFDAKMEYYSEIKASEKKGIKVSALLIDKFEKEVRDAEKKFRRAIHALLPRMEPEDKLDYIETKKEWKWLPLLYPSVYTIRRQVYFMSIDKFVSVHDTIIDRAYKFYESATLNDSILFFDEFDASKDTILNHIIKDGLERVDYLGMFRAIYFTLQDRDNLYTEFYLDSPATVKSKGKGHLRKMADEVFTAAKTLNDEFHLENLFISRDKTAGNYIFHDFMSQTVGKSGQFKILRDEDRRVHDIYFDRNEYTTDFHITTLFSQMYSFFRKFEGFIRAQAKAHVDVQAEKGEVVPMDAALCTMLDPYGFNQEQINYLLSAIRLTAPTKRTDKTRGYDASIYNTGLAYYDFEDDINHNLTTKVYSTAFNLTPEKILLKVLERGGVKVVGISATACLETVVGNYHLFYMRHRAECMEEKITEEDWDRLRATCMQSFAGYDKLKLHAIVIDGEDEGWFDRNPDEDVVFHDPSNYGSLKLRLSSIGEFAKKRYLKLAKAYKVFLQNDSIKSFLAFFTRGVRKMEDEFDPENPFCREDIEAITVAVAKEVGVTFDDKLKPFEVLKGIPNEEEFEKQMDEYRYRLYNGEKMFLITTYATVGAGQNLQYARPEGGDFIEINEFKQTVRKSMPSFKPEDIMETVPKKDFDGIYLDEPTFIVPRVKQNDRESLVKALFIIEFLMEAHEISSRDAREAIQNCFKAYHAPLKADIPFKGRNSVRMAYAKQIIQAIGRICRTNLKNKDVFLLVDSNIKNVLSEDIDKYGKLRNPEFDEVYKALKEYQNVKPLKVPPQADGSDLASARAHAEIQKYLKKEYWDDELVAAWKDLRRNVMVAPTCEEKTRSMFYYSYYCRLTDPAKSIRYTERMDYSIVYVDPHGTSEVSQESARLEQLMALPGVTEWFDENGYAMEWKENVRIMSPVLFHNIYLGALGEETGHAIFNQWKVPLEDLPCRIYEKFDFRINESTYVDFKHHAGRMRTDRDKEIEHICRKFEEINKRNGNDLARKVYIINILQNEDGLKEIKTTEKDGFTIVEIPYLYDKYRGRNKEAYKMLMKEIGKEAEE